MKKLPFIVQILIALIGTALSVVGIAFYLDSYTNHGKTAKVPKVAGLSMKDAISAIKNAGFDYRVDSTYRDSLKPLEVVKQYPLAGDLVKDGRTVQIIVNKSVAPQIAMPGLVGVRLSSALQYLDRNNLVLEDTIFKPDFATGRVLAQMQNGKEIVPGTMIGYGTKITLVVSGGLGDLIYNYPDLYGKTLKEAFTILDQLGLSRGAISVDPGVADSLGALVYKQYPEPMDLYEKKPTLIRQGNTVDLFISNVLKPKEVDTTKVLIENDEFINAARAENENLDYGAGAEEDPTGKKKKKKSKPKPKAAATVPKPTAAPEY